MYIYYIYVYTFTYIYIYICIHTYTYLHKYHMCMYMFVHINVPYWLPKLAQHIGMWCILLLNNQPTAIFGKSGSSCCLAEVGGVFLRIEVVSFEMPALAACKNSQKVSLLVILKAKLHGVKTCVNVNLWWPCVLLSPNQANHHMLLYRCTYIICICIYMYIYMYI